MFTNYVYFYIRKKFINETVEKEKAYQEACKDEVEDFGPSKLAFCQQILWDTFEKPHKSYLARYISVMSISLVLLSTVGMCLNTMPTFRDHSYIMSSKIIRIKRVNVANDPAKGDGHDF